MMLRNKIIVSFFFLTVVITLIWSCQEDEFIPLKINSVSPIQVLVGDTITISGEGFSPDYAVNRIYFPSVDKYVTPIAGSTTNKLVVPVPDSATTGSIRINILNEEIFDSPSITITPPVFESITPNTGYVGDTIIIRGENFQADANNKNHVKFKGTQGSFPVGNVINSTRTELRVIVPEGAVAGNISVLGFQGPKFNFKVGKITSINPTIGIVGDTISIQGIGFPEDAVIYFNQGVSALDVQEGVTSTSRQRYAIVPAEASNGKLRMTYETSATSTISLLSDSIFQIYPSITDLSSLAGPPGLSLTIKGYSFTPKRAPAVNTISAFINGLAVTVKSFDNQNIVVTIPASATSGQVKVIVNGRVALGPEFQVSAAGTPVMESLSKTEGFVGDEVIIYGQGFNPDILDNTVKIGNVNANINAATANALTITIPASAVTGKITGTSNGIAAVGDLSFTVKIPVINFTINSVSPVLLKQDDPITINGSNFSTAGDISPYITAKSTSSSASYRFTDMDFTSTKITGPAYTYHEPNSETKPVYMPGDYDLTIRYNANPTEDVSNKKVISIQGSINPFIKSISPLEGKTDQAIDILGEYFNGDGAKNIVTFTGATSSSPAEFVSFIKTGNANSSTPTEAKLTVKIPSLPPGNYNVTVNNGVGQITQSVVFTINADEVVTIEPKPVYYLGQDGSTISLKKITKDSPTPTTIFNAPNGLTAMVVDVKTDVLTSKVYFSEKSEVEANHGIFSMKIDGTAKNRIVITPKPVDGEGVDNTYCATISDLSLDAVNSTLFWVRTADFKISSTKTNNNPIINPVSVKNLNASKYYLTSGLTCSDGKLYTAAFYDNSIDQSTTSDLLSIDIQATDKPITTIFDEADNIGIISDVKIDQSNSKLYILASAFNSSGTAEIYSIYTADLNGGNKQTLIQFEEGTRVSGISLDLQDKYVYYLQVKSGSQSSIAVTRMDGVDITPGVKTQTVYENLSFINPGSGAGAIAVEAQGGGAAGRIGSMNMQLKYRIKKRK